MPNVISDTSSIQYLYQLNLLNLLPTLYNQITIPSGVANELAQGITIGISLPNPATLNWNISVFHYRNNGADYGRIVVGSQVPPDEMKEWQ